MRLAELLGRRRTFVPDAKGATVENPVAAGGPEVASRIRLRAD